MIKMEYEVLGIPENSSMEEARRAMHKIRLANHPDKLTNVSINEKEKSQQFLILAEKAYKRIKDKQIVNESISSIFDSRNIFSNFSSIIPPDIQHYTDQINTGQTTVQSSSYSYSNVNGRVSESGIINGKKMDEDELKIYRKQSFINPLESSLFRLN